MQRTETRADNMGNDIIHANRAFGEFTFDTTKFPSLYYRYLAEDTSEVWENIIWDLGAILEKYYHCDDLDTESASISVSGEDFDVSLGDINCVLKTISPVVVNGFLTYVVGKKTMEFLVSNSCVYFREGLLIDGEWKKVECEEQRQA